MIIKLKSPRLLLPGKRKRPMQLRKGASADYRGKTFFLVLEIVEELGYTRKSWLALAFYLDGKLDAGLADTTEILNLMECCHEANT